MKWGAEKQLERTNAHERRPKNGCWPQNERKDTMVFSSSREIRTPLNRGISCSAQRVASLLRPLKAQLFLSLEHYSNVRRAVRAPHPPSRPRPLLISSSWCPLCPHVQLEHFFDFLSPPTKVSRDKHNGPPSNYLRQMCQRLERTHPLHRQPTLRARERPSQERSRRELYDSCLCFSLSLFLVLFCLF